MKAQDILNQVERNFGGTTPDNALDIIEEMATLKSFGDSVYLKRFEDRGISIGFYTAVADAIKDWRRVNYAAPLSAKEARIQIISSYLKSK